MAISLKRKLYTRGGSFETTVPMQLLFSTDLEKKNNVLFEYDKDKGRWYIDIVEDSGSDAGSMDKSGKKNNARKGGGKK